VHSCYAQDSNAEYIYIIEDKEVWFIDKPDP
jgi:hypothetical protein